jgi:hypothetical protein
VTGCADIHPFADTGCGHEPSRLFSTEQAPLGSTWLRGGGFHERAGVRNRLLPDPNGSGG